MEQLEWQKTLQLLGLCNINQGSSKMSGDWGEDSKKKKTEYILDGC